METNSGLTASRTIPLTRDVWYEVLQYFRYDVTFDFDEEISEQRTSILSIALLSPSLTSMALDLLWKGMRSLKPVATVVNSFASSQDDIYLAEVQGSANGEGIGWHWELWRLIEDDIVHHHVREYLSRVQIFWIDKTTALESYLWPILEVCFGRNLPLLPKLQHLGLCCGAKLIRPILGQIPLLFPVFTALEIDHGVYAVDTVLLALRLFKSRGCKLKCFKYSGISAPDLLLALMNFKDLKQLDITDSRDWVPRQESSNSPSAVLKHFASLTRLQIDLRIFPNRQAIISSPVHHPTLENLRITGDARDLQDFITEVTSDALHTLKLTINDKYGLSWKVLCGQAASSFPHIRSLSLVSLIAGDGPLLVAGDLSAIVSKPLTAFWLRDISHRLTADGLTATLKMLPTLRTLSIDYVLGQPPDEVAFDASILVPLSQHPLLNHFDLCLDFSAYVTPLPDTGPSSRSAMEKLFIFDPKNFPSTVGKKLALAQNLLMLFPRLRIIEHDEEEKVGIADLQKCITALNQKAVACYFGRRM